MAKMLSPLTRVSDKNSVVQVLNYGKRFVSAKFDSSPYDLYKIDRGPATTAELTKEDGLKFFRTMNLIRKMEKEVGVLYSKKIARGFCHLYSGQEAVGVGVRSMMLPQDTAIASYRCHAWMMLMGNSIESIFSELVGGRKGEPNYICSYFSFIII